MSKKYTLWVVLLLYNCTSLFSQAQNEKLIDSLIQVIPSVPNNKMENHVVTFLKATAGLSTQEALQRNQQALDVAKKNNQPYATIRFELHGAWIRGNLEESYQWHKEMVQYAESVNDSSLLIQALEALAIFQIQNDLKEEGFLNIHRAINFAQKTKNEIQYFDLRLELLTISYNTGDYAKTEEIGREILRMYNTRNKSFENKSESMMTAYNTIGLNFKNLKQYDSSLHYLELSRQAAQKLNNKAWEALIVGNIGAVYFSLGKYEDALRNLLYDVRYSQKNESWNSAINAMIMISDIHLIKGNLKMASTYLDSAILLQQNLHHTQITSAYWNSLSNLEFARGNYAAARQAQQHYTEQRIESIRNQGAANLAKAQNSFDLKAKQQEIETLTENTNSQKQQLILQRYALIAAIIALMLAIAFVISFVYNYRRQKRINATIQQHRKELQTAYYNLQQTQNQLIQVEKMAFLGRLTSGIAHEVNTPLGAVKASYENINRSFAEVQGSIQEMAIKIPPTLVNKILSLFTQIKVLPISIPFSQRREMKKKCIQTLNEMGIKNADSMADYLMEMGITDQYEKWKDILLLPDALSVFQYLTKVSVIKAQNENIGLAVSKASKILFALKIYSQSASAEADQVLSVTENVETVLSIYAGNFSMIEVDRHYEPVPFIKGNTDELSQVWTNLIHNSMQAMCGIGKLTIAINMLAPTELKVEVSDTGHGISEENQKRLFEPFFTTKQAGEGTGLGLSIVQKIVEKYHGRIEVESKPGKGTMFRIILPVTHDNKV